MFLSKKLKNGVVPILILILVFLTSTVVVVTVAQNIDSITPYIFKKVDLTGSSQPASRQAVEIVKADADKDGFDDTIETAIGTLPNQACGSRVNASKPGSPSVSWPPDLVTLSSALGDGLGKINIHDVVSFTGPVRKLDAKSTDPAYDKRWDLDANGVVDVADIEIVKSYMNTTCPY